MCVCVCVCILIARLYNKIRVINPGMGITGMGEGYKYTEGWMVYHNFNFYFV